jgi:diadenosine tetraphosphate (Ap4A) HIT family hydrolase
MSSSRRSFPTRKRSYWRETLRVGRALAERFTPVKLNFETHGNTLPHLHTHVMPRYADDPRPGQPFPYPEGAGPPPLPEADFRADAAVLRRLLTE